LTIRTIAAASIWLPVPLHLGLDATHIVLLMLTCVVTVLTVVPGRAMMLRAAVHFYVARSVFVSRFQPVSTSWPPCVHAQPTTRPTLARFALVSP
jgi:Ca2+:H+ antiporter